MPEHSIQEMVKHVLVIDESDNSKEQLINSNQGNDVPNKFVEYEGAMMHKDSALKCVMVITPHQKHLIK